MKVVTTPDGTISVIELDPTKQHLIIADADAMTFAQWAKVRLRDGAILLKRPGTEIQIVEGETLPDRVEVKE